MTTVSPAPPALDSASEPADKSFGLWLKDQLKAKKMTQRQLAERSGVDHSTISRLIRGGQDPAQQGRVPSLTTVTRLSTGLRENYTGSRVSETNPAARIEHALRSDPILSESQIKDIMEQYLRHRHANLTAIASSTSIRATAPAIMIRRSS